MADAPQNPAGSPPAAAAAPGAREKKAKKKVKKNVQTGIVYIQSRARAPVASRRCARFPPPASRSR